MRRIYTMLAIAGMFFAAACSQDEVSETQIGGESQVTFTTELPNALATSRTMGDGTTATTLSYAIYKAGTTTPLITSEDEVTFNSELKATFDVSLANGMSYDIVFWADAENSIYTFDPATQSITANYTTANQESYDAFYAVVKNMAVNGAAKQPVELYRPFAQLNIGTNDTDQAATAGLVVSETSIKVNAYKTLNLYSGEVSDEINLTYAMYDIPTVDTFPIAAHDYLAMNYILVPADPSTYDVTFTVYENETSINTRTYTAVPLQRNYKTNIYGRLLTSTTEFNVEIKPAFATPDKPFEAPESVWEGDVEEPSVDAADPNVYVVGSAAELAWLAQEVNNGTTFAGKTVKLTANIDLENKPWEPIGTTGDKAGFQGTFDGQGHVISNLYVSIPNGEYLSAGLFGSARYATIKDFTVNNANIEGVTEGSASTCGFAVVVGSAQFPVTISNVEVYNATINSNRYTGAIAGYFAGTIEGCTVDGLTIVTTADNTQGSYDNGDKVGGIMGYANGAVTLTNNSVNNFNITATRDMGGIAGSALDNACVVTDNTVTNGILTVDQRLIGIGSEAANTREIVGRGVTPDASNTSSNVTIYTTAADGSLTDAQGNLYVTNSEQLKGAIANANNTTMTTIAVSDGIYEGCFEIANKKITLKASGDAANFNGMIFISSAEVVLQGLNLNNSNGTQKPNPTNSKYYNSINEQYPLIGIYDGANVTVEECTLDITAPTIYGVYGYSNNNLTFKKSTFNCNGIRPIAANVYALTVDGCTFIDQYHYSVRIYENSEKHQTIIYTNNTVKGTNGKGEFEGINISKKSNTAVVKGTFTVSGNNATYDGTSVELKYRHHSAVTLDPTCTFNGVTFESE